MKLTLHTSTVDVVKGRIAEVVPSPRFRHCPSVSDVVSVSSGDISDGEAHTHARLRRESENEVFDSARRILNKRTTAMATLSSYYTFLSRVVSTCVRR